MGGSCHFDRSSNIEISVEYYKVCVMFFLMFSFKVQRADLTCDVLGSGKFEYSSLIGQGSDHWSLTLVTSHVFYKITTLSEFTCFAPKIVLY